LKKHVNEEDEMEEYPVSQSISYSIDNMVSNPNDPDVLMQNEIMELHRMRNKSVVKNTGKGKKFKMRRFGKIKTD
jgi:hypothetical protein